ncbi:hypothetical protein B0I37DRAFT_110448 [Chaetomium sp. MPI-CAGE-AT-0009]|nr:hypothetical protein B0I37DRAFT_110448 [Chaetomium sp. MPI-CAGE-AT-0009]
MDRVKEAAAEAANAATASSARPESISVGKSEALPPKRAARLPGPARFVLAVVLSFALSSLGRSFVDHWSNNEMGSIAREITSQTEQSVLVGWKLLGLALGWYAGYDGFDVAALALLAHGPTTVLVSLFYGTRILTAGAYLAVEVVSACLPFLLLRRLSDAHSAAPGTFNWYIVADRGILLLTSLQSAIAYTTAVCMVGRLVLPTNLVLYFEGIPTIQPAAKAPFFGLDELPGLPLCLLCGLAARTFIFVPLVTTPETEEDVKNAEFDPVHATLTKTLVWNMWGYTTRAKVSIVRTAVAMLFTAVGTYLDTALAISGVEPYGAVVYAGVWVSATFVTGLMLHSIGNL